MNISRRSALQVAMAAAALPVEAEARHAVSSTPWWAGAVIYEIYIRSFQDSNGDGIGDLKGIISRLDYLHDLGIDAIWITPFYPSPLVDFGYDISDYRGIDPEFGTLDDFDQLVKQARARGIRIVIDMVLNHTSDQHKWFLESKSSRTNPKADWYVWNDGKRDADGKPQPPNNWQSLFGGSSWQWSEERQQYYYHEFYKQQPDLNWRNPEVEKAMFDTIRWWMDRGVSGFRLDAITSLFEDPRGLDERVTTEADGTVQNSREYTDDVPGIHPVLQRLRKVVDEKPGTLLLGETYLPTVKDLRRYYGVRRDELHLAMNTRYAFVPEISAGVLRDRLSDMVSGLSDVTPLIFYNNHDNTRSISRFHPAAGHETDFAKLLATLTLTPRATAVLYYGEEIGMVDHTPERIEDVRDPVGRVKWPRDKGRDGERTPMQWDGSPQAGFTTSSNPWLPVGADHVHSNVADEAHDPQSILSFYKALLGLRRSHPDLKTGAMTLMDVGNAYVLGLARKSGGKTIIILCNIGDTPQSVVGVKASLLLGNSVTSGSHGLEFGPYGVFVGEATGHR